jgi:hypothetical protein
MNRLKCVEVELYRKDGDSEILIKEFGSVKEAIDYSYENNIMPQRRMYQTLRRDDFPIIKNKPKLWPKAAYYRFAYKVFKVSK